MKKITLIILSLTIGSFGLFYYYWKQFTNLPEWYTNKAEAATRIVDIRNPDKVNEAKLRLEERVATHLVAKELEKVAKETESDSPFDTRPMIGNSADRSDPNGVELKLNEKEFSALLVSNFLEKVADRPFLDSTEGFNATIKNGAIEAGVVLNVSALRSEKLAAGEKATLDKAIQSFPFLENREVYLAIEGKPSVKNGQLNLDDSTRFKVGNVSLTLAELSQKLGISKEQLAEKINLELHLGKVQINDIQFQGDRALIRGSVKENL